jgi:hypothetical protein
MRSSPPREEDRERGLHRRARRHVRVPAGERQLLEELAARPTTQPMRSPGKSTFEKVAA